MKALGSASPGVNSIRVSCYVIPTEVPESDGTLEWSKTTLVLVEALAAGKEGIGFTYADLATGKLIETLLADVVRGMDALDIPRMHAAMRCKIRNLGRPGIASMAISAVDNALWDLKAKMLECSLLDLLGASRASAEVYGSGGFTSYTRTELQEQLAGWVSEGVKSVKMKVGRDPDEDLERVSAAKSVIGPDVNLFVDANGAFSRKQALALAVEFAERGVQWFEEPVSSDDLEGLRFLRDHVPAGMNIAAGEYGYDACCFLRMLNAGAVDVLQADATRCGGITGFLQAGILCHAFGLPFSFHCAPSLHAIPACASPSFSIGEYFIDHVRIERLLFDGFLSPVGGVLKPDRSRPGLGIEFKRADALRYAI